MPVFVRFCFSGLLLIRLHRSFHRGDRALPEYLSALPVGAIYQPAAQSPDCPNTPFLAAIEYDEAGIVWSTAIRLFKFSFDFQYKHIQLNHQYLRNLREMFEKYEFWTVFS